MAPVPFPFPAPVQDSGFQLFHTPGGALGIYILFQCMLLDLNFLAFSSSRL